MKVLINLILTMLLPISVWAENAWDEIPRCEAPLMTKQGLLKMFAPATAELGLDTVVHAHLYSSRCHELTGCRDWVKMDLTNTNMFATIAYGNEATASGRYTVVKPFDITTKAFIKRGALMFELKWTSKYPTKMVQEFTDGTFENFESYIGIWPKGLSNRRISLDEAQGSFHEDGCFYGEIEIKEISDYSNQDFYNKYKVILKSED